MRWTASAATVLFAVLLATGHVSSQKAAPGAAAASSATRRAQFLEMFARGYFPGRTGQLMIVPREGDIITRREAAVVYMHGSPWPYDSRIPVMFAGPQVVTGIYATPALQQDVAVTVAGALGVDLPPTATGRRLPILRANAERPRAAFILVLDGMRPDYFDRYAKEMPALGALRKRSAWFSQARVNYIPTNTAAGHSSIATGSEPRFHGISGNNLYDRAQRRRHDMYEGWNPRDLTALTIADVWQMKTRGRAVIIAQGSSLPSSTALAGHGACQLNGSRVLHAAYDETTGFWKSNADCFTLLPEIAALDARTLWPADGLWMGHKVDTVSEIRRSAYFTRFEADAFLKAIDSQPLGQDDVPDLLLLNVKGADYIGHKHGPDSPEMATALHEIDQQLARILKAIEAKTGANYLVAVTADHGMPSEPRDSSRRHFAVDIVDAIHARFDPQGKTLIPYYEPENSQIFVDLDRLAALKLTLKEVAAFLQSQPYVFAMFTEDEVRLAAARLR
jgi:Type I phosphodiesterase / nucleotide pyrophosphatase